MKTANGGQRQHLGSNPTLSLGTYEVQPLGFFNHIDLEMALKEKRRGIFGLNAVYSFAVPLKI